jgi:multisubunit Na+/H+ antiporter MnhF subunit
VVLGYGATALVRRGSRARPVALAATGFAIVGFLVGLSFTLAGGSAIDVAYHLSVLPLLLLILLGLTRSRDRSTGSVRARP